MPSPQWGAPRPPGRLGWAFTPAHRREQCLNLLPPLTSDPGRQEPSRPQGALANPACGPWGSQRGPCWRPGAAAGAASSPGSRGSAPPAWGRPPGRGRGDNGQRPPQPANPSGGWTGPCEGSRVLPRGRLLSPSLTGSRQRRGTGHRCFPWGEADAQEVSGTCFGRRSRE